MIDILENKKKLVLTLAVISIMIMTIIPTVIAAPPEERPLKDFDWNDWQNKPNMFSIPPGNVGIGTHDPNEKLTLGFLNNFAIEMEPPKHVMVTPAIGGELTQGLTYYFRVVACLGLTTTMPSLEVECTLEGGSVNNRCSLTWDPVTGATHYRVYIGLSDGEQDHYQTSYTNSYNYDNDNGADWEEPPQTTTAYVNKISSFGNSWFLGGNVGIGKIPDAELDVSGDIQVSGDYKYSNAKTYYLYISGIAFIQQKSSSDDTWDVSNFGAGYISDGTYPYLTRIEAPVSLPQGANVTNVTMYYLNADSSEYANLIFEFYFSRIELRESTSENIAYINYPVASYSSSIQEKYDNTISNSIIDNENYHYGIFGTWNQNNYIGDNMQLFGLRIEYTMDTVNP